MSLSNSEVIKFNKASLLLHECRDMDMFNKAVLKGLHGIISYNNGAHYYVNQKMTKLTGFKSEMTTCLGSFTEHNQLFINLFSFFADRPFTEQLIDDYDYRPFREQLIDDCNYIKDEVIKNPNGLYYGASLNLVNDGFVTVRINIYRCKDRGDFTTNEKILLYLYATHMQSVYNRLTEELIVDGTWEFLRQFNQGICIFNSNGECMFANQKAQEMFDRHINGLFYMIKNVYQQFIALYGTQFPSLSNYSGKTHYNNADIQFNCFALKKKEKFYVFVVFEFAEVLRNRTNHMTFTAREKEVLQAIAQGKTNKEIGQILSIKQETVKTHIRNLFVKTGMNSRAALVAKWLT